MAWQRSVDTVGPNEIPVCSGVMQFTHIDKGTVHTFNEFVIDENEELRGR